MLRKWLAAGLALAFSPLSTLQCRAADEDVAQFFKDKQLRMIVGSSAGDGYDINARVVARHWAGHIPGKPSIIVQNQPGAGSVPSVNTVYNTAPRDGTVMGAPINGMTTAPLLMPDSVKYDVTKLIWLGSSNHDIQLTYVWHTAPVSTAQDLLTTELLVGATTPGATHVDYPVVARAIFGLKFKVVSGYPGTAPVHIAIERGEVQGFGANGWLALKALNANWISENKIKLVLQYGLERNPMFPNVPALGELAKTEAQRQAVELLATRLRYGRPFYLPPDVPAARVEALRRAFDATMADPAFLAEAEKAKLDIQPMKGEEIGPLIARVMATPPTVVKQVRDALEGGAQ